MTINRILLTLRRYGIKGVWDWIARHLWKSDPFLAKLQSHVRANTAPERGITLIGDFGANHSLGKVFRDFAQSLAQADIPHQLVNTSEDIPDHVILNRYADIISLFRADKLKGLGECRTHHVVFWEFDTGLVQAHPDLSDERSIIAFSQFCFDVFRKQLRPNVAIRPIRYPFHFEAENLAPSPEIRRKFGMPENAFMVFYNFDYRSSYYRKNPEGLLNAFVEAFGNTPDAILTFKTNGRKANILLAEKLERIVTESGIANRIFFINDYISTGELISLTAACDVYASLHRGEGFGLGMAEAMSLGKAVVATNYGANREFCTVETSELIPYKMVAVLPEQNCEDLYKWVREWPEPDVHAAAAAMRKLYDDPEYRKSLGLRGQAFIKDHYSLANFKKSIEAFLDR